MTTSTRGFLSGHLWLDIPADPFLATLANPKDPAQRAGHGLHDASYFKGHYYIYFGVTPVILLFAPIKLLTGLEVDQAWAAVVFSWVGLAGAAGLLATVRRRHFPEVPFPVLALGVGALGVANTVPLLLRRASVWEVPIAAAFACLMLGYCFLYKALDGRRPAAWLALGSVAFGLAVGARPTYLFACAALLVPLWVLARQAGGLAAAWSTASWRRDCLAALLPVAAIGAGLAAYNFERFASPVEFGQLYQMSGDDNSKIKFFGWQFPLYGARLYWLARATWSPYFPFVSVADIPPRPGGQFGVEDPYGILPNIPFVFLALGTWSLIRRPRDATRGPLGAFCLCAAVATAATALFILPFGGVTNRYLVDFAPGCVLLASIGLLAWVGGAPRGSARRVLVCALAVLLFLYSAAFNVFASFRHNELLRAEHPELYQRMVRRWNTLPYAFDRLFHRGYGPLEMSVEFPRGVPGTNEPLLATGHGYLSDYLFVHYEPGDMVTFGLDHTNRGVILGHPLRISPGVPHAVLIELGSLYPPVGHPYFASLDPIESWIRQSRFKVTVDGQVALEGYTSFYDAFSWEPLVGRAKSGAAYPGRFTGQILSLKRRIESTAGTQGTARPTGPLVLKLTLPPLTGRLNEPLVCSGETGRGDLVYIRYLGPSKVAIGFDHWGVGGTESQAVDVNPAGTQEISIDYGAIDRQPLAGDEGAAGSPGHLSVKVNGRTVINADQNYYRCPPDQVGFGRNTIGSSSAGPEFRGTIHELTFLGH